MYDAANAEGTSCSIDRRRSTTSSSCPTTSSPRSCDGSSTRLPDRPSDTRAPRGRSGAQSAARTTTGSAGLAAGRSSTSPSCIWAPTCSCPIWPAGGERACRRCPTPRTRRLRPTGSAKCSLPPPQRSTAYETRDLRAGKRWRTPGSSTRRFRPSRCSGSRAGGGCSSARTRETRSCALSPFGEVDLEFARLWSESAFAGLTSRVSASRRACRVD